jgi:hypothetical protein
MKTLLYSQGIGVCKSPRRAAFLDLHTPHQRQLSSYSYRIAKSEYYLAVFAPICVKMPPELRREQERTRRTKYEGPEPPKKRAVKKRSGKQALKRPAKRKRQQIVNQADKPLTDADKAVEAAQQLVAFKKLAVTRQKAAKAASAPAPT